MSSSEQTVVEPGDGVYRAEAGFEFPIENITITRDEQRRLHGWCDIEPEVFGELADPTFVARRPVLLNTATMRQSRPRWGKVHTVHRITQRRPIRLDETLVMSGRINSLEPHPKGIVIKSTWTYRDARGEIPFIVEPDLLMIDPGIEPLSRSARSEHDVETGKYEFLARKQCTPESTLGYCEGSENPIHLDPEYARGFGFRAPIIAGMQTVNFLLEPVYRRQPPDTLALHIRFLRPVFWDDALVIEGRRDDSGGLQAVRALNEDGKCVADCQFAG
ncbi:MAG: MaoC/PaaZ C-terminal domain-containing protein [Gammaproteobacteria bacterium]|nr:MaoC/PaaZ C-terminal domain-containing protein [Gammaproteobacteria bacterium]